MSMLYRWLQVLEETAPRYMSIDCPNEVLLTVTNLPDNEESAVSVNINPLKPEQGEPIDCFSPLE
jgi:hypothetical protein